MALTNFWADEAVPQITAPDAVVVVPSSLSVPIKVIPFLILPKLGSIVLSASLKLNVSLLTIAMSTPPAFNRAMVLFSFPSSLTVNEVTEVSPNVFGLSGPISVYSLPVQQYNCCARLSNQNSPALNPKGAVAVALAPPTGLNLVPS